jgi:hypothetical protein
MGDDAEVTDVFLICHQFSMHVEASGHRRRPEGQVYRCREPDCSGFLAKRCGFRAGSVE